MQTIDQFRSGLDGETRAMMDRLRGIVAASHPSLVERIKWNAPSFALGDEDRITLGVERKGGVRLVLHRGSKPRETDSFQFDDPDAWARWLAPDRGVIVWKRLVDIEAASDALRDLCRRWIDTVG